MKSVLVEFKNEDVKVMFSNQFMNKMRSRLFKETVRTYEYL